MKTLCDFAMEDIALMAMNEVCDGKTVCLSFFYKEICALVKELLVYDGVQIESIAIEDPLWDGYNDEYLVTLTDEGDKIALNCEKLKIANKEGYLMYESDVLFVGSNVHYGVVKSNLNEFAVVTEVSIDDEEEEDGEFGEDSCDDCWDECDVDDDDEDADEIHVSVKIDGDEVSADMTMDQLLLLASLL